MAGGKQKQPTMKRTSDTSQVPSFFARWERLETARRESSEDLKELFSEAKAFGLNGKALRVVFAEKYRDENEDAGKRSKRLETGADVELYRSALARVRESDADNEPAEHPAADADEQAHSSDAGSSAPIQEIGASGLAVTGVGPASAVHSGSVIAGDARNAGSTDYPATGDEAQSDAGGENVADHAERQTGFSDVALAGEGRGADSVALGSDVEPVAPSTIIRFAPKDDNRPRSSEGLPRPYGCKNVDACATTWRAEQPCTLCRAEIAIEVGGVSIPHHGEVA